jgi:hypothetical protein
MESPFRRKTAITTEPYLVPLNRLVKRGPDHFKQLSRFRDNLTPLEPPHLSRERA